MALKPAPQWVGLLMSSNQALPADRHCRDCEAIATCQREHLKAAESPYCGYLPGQFIDKRKTHTARMAGGRS